MADNVTVDNAALTDYVVATEELSGGEQMQSVELHTEAAGAKTKLAKLEDAAHSSGDAGIQMLTVRKDTAAATAGTDGDYQPPITDASGRLHVNGSGVTQPVSGTVTANAGTGTFTVDTELSTKDYDSGGGTETVAVAGLIVPASGGSVNITGDAANGLDVDVTRVSGTVTVAGAVTNAGTFATQVDGAALTALQLIDDTVFADDSAFTVATSKVNALGMLADETSTDSVDEGDIGLPRMTLDRKIIVTVEPHTAGGWDVKNCTSGDGSTALTNSAQAIKASAGKLGGWFIYNPNATAAYVPIYNVASGSVTVGTTNPLLVLTIPATSAANLEMVNGLTFDTAIAVAAATTAAGNTAMGTALEANFFYK